VKALEWSVAGGGNRNMGKEERCGVVSEMRKKEERKYAMDTMKLWV
jgi:hypothetical protein